MNAEALKAKIEFKSRDIGHNLTMLTGTLEVHGRIDYDRQAIAGYEKSALDECKEVIRETIMRQLYDDQRRELYDALDELFMAHPMDYTAMAAAREKVLLAAKRQRGG